MVRKEILMAEIKPYSDEELDFAENKLKVLSHIVEDDDTKAIEIARWCIERERYDNMDKHWRNVR